MLETDHLFFRAEILNGVDNAQEHLTRQVLCHIFCALEPPSLAASLCTGRWWSTDNRDDDDDHDNDGDVRVQERERERAVVD
jgi:hypothetical protein